METEVFVFTASRPEARRHRERTIERMVPLAEIEPFAARVAAGLAKDGLDAVRCWGSIPGDGNLGTYARMRPGHWGLLYGGDGEFPWLLRLGRKAQAKRLARSLWGEDPSGRTWELMFFFDAAYRINLGIEEVRGAFGYVGDGWTPRGLHYPAEAHQAAMLEKFGSFERFGATAATAPPSNVGAAALSPEEQIMGGPLNRPPEKPPRSPRRLQLPDPDRTGRGYMAHEATVQKLRLHIGPGIEKGTKGINHDGGWKRGAVFCISEVKSVTAKNEVGQLQKGLGQVLHNRFKARAAGAKKVEAYLIAEREPTNSDLWKELASEHDVVFTWPERFAKDIPKSAARRRRS